MYTFVEVQHFISFCLLLLFSLTPCLVGKVVFISVELITIFFYAIRPIHAFYLFFWRTVTVCPEVLFFLNPLCAEVRFFTRFIIYGFRFNDPPKGDIILSFINDFSIHSVYTFMIHFFWVSRTSSICFFSDRKDIKIFGCSGKLILGSSFVSESLCMLCQLFFKVNKFFWVVC